MVDLKLRDMVPIKLARSGLFVGRMVQNGVFKGELNEFQKFGNFKFLIC